MYYSYKCPYCGRVFYTYDTDRERASRTLYASIKQHLIDYNEDHKEYELDDGEREDSDQIYAGMSESKDEPVGAYEATVTSLQTGGSTPTPYSSSTYAPIATILVILVLVIVVIVGVLYLNPSLLSGILALFS